jgi:hypothetical protein
MADGYSIFTTYILVPTGTTSGLGYNYSEAIHCNYIKKTQSTIANQSMGQITINFPNISDFKFLSDDPVNNTGYTANKIYALVQIISNSGYTSIDEVKAISTEWRMVDITNQIPTHTDGNALTAAELTSVVFKVPFNNYYSYPIYNLNYLNYPTKEVGDDDKLSFGDEIYFFGNVSTEIKAIAYTTDLSINLPLNQFNSSTNSTWTQDDSVAISEIGIYDANKNLVAIGKLNNPILKDETIARTIVFNIDF